MSKARELAELGAVYDSGALSNRNLIINGAMQVAQRGTSATTFAYGTVDRFKPSQGSTSSLAITQTQDTNAPSGFSNSLKITVTTAETMSGSKQLAVFHPIEAQNLQQLGYGTSEAQYITVSFYVKSSVTGVYCLSLYENDDNRNIGATYTINSANTWERKTVTFPPDTVGVIDNNNGAGLELYFFLSVGADRKTTDNTSWATWSAARFGFGQVADVGATTNATWQITGVQLEAGTEATPFEHRSFGDELLRCQRYYQETSNATNYSMVGDGTCQSSVVSILFDYLCEMRTSPSVSALGTNGSSSWYIQSGSTTISTASAAFNGAWAAGTNSQRAWMDWTGVSGQTASSTAAVYRNNQLTSNKNGCLAFDAEL